MSAARSSQLSVQQYGSALCIENLKTVIKLTIGQPAFYHHHVLAILNNVSDEMLLGKKSVVGLSSKQFLCLLLSFNNIYIY